MRVKLNGITLSVSVDEDPVNPRKWDNFGSMVCWYKRYSLGDNHNYNEPMDFLKSEVCKNSVKLPVYLLDHSGLRVSTTDFNDRWDSGLVGYIFKSHEGIINEFGDLSQENINKTKKLLAIEVQDYDKYLSGDFYFYSIEGLNGELLDCCGGFEGGKDMLKVMKETAGKKYASLFNKLIKENQAEM